jgi:hypothetical protein
VLSYIEVNWLSWLIQMGCGLINYKQLNFQKPTFQFPASHGDLFGEKLEDSRHLSGCRAARELSVLSPNNSQGE